MHRTSTPASPGRISCIFEDKLDTFSRMMAEHMAVPFPPDFPDLDIEDQDMVMVDADACGCVAGGLKVSLSEQHRAGLTRLTSVFEKVLPAIDHKYATKYSTPVRDMVVLATKIESLREK